MNKKEKQWHIQYGKDSGIPDCCIDFFVNEWLYTSDNFPRLHITYTNFITRIEKEQNIRFEYIPCPNCIQNPKVLKNIKCPPRNERPNSSNRPQKIMYFWNDDGTLGYYPINKT